VFLLLGKKVIAESEAKLLKQAVPFGLTVQKECLEKLRTTFEYLQ
jgi:hypothetical protein